MLRSCALVLFVAAAVCGAEPAPRTVSIQVDANAGRRPISPYLFGKNNDVSKLDPQFVRDVGLRIARDSGGNNCTKYNWKNDFSSHPDWYNNVYKQNLPERATKLSTQFGDLQVLYGLQVLGYVAKTDQYNFHEMEVHPRPDPHKALCGHGNPSLYLEPFSPKDTVDMLDYWFKPKPKGLALDPGHFRYVHLDNEPECWPSTHKDVCSKMMAAEECVRRYAAVAKELKTRYPNIRILAPGFASEWFWWAWADQKNPAGLPWMQFFVKRMAEESKLAKLRLLDVVDFHTYIGGDISDAGLLQQHRVFYDPHYESPQANGSRWKAGAKPLEDPKVEFVFGRMEQWLNDYFGPNHGIGIGITESGPGKRPAMVEALWYASMLGTFADHGVELYTAWEWYEPYWEVLHLFSRYGHAERVQTSSSDEEFVSAYASIDEKNKHMTVIVLNRDPSARCTAKIALQNFQPRADDYETLTLAKLPDVNVRTFKSHTVNALKKGLAAVQGTALTVELPPYAIVAVELDAEYGPEF